MGYELDPETECQLTPKRVDALSEDRVVGVALGLFFTLAVTDAGAVFSFGQSGDGSLGHGVSTSEVLPRRIEALAETGWRFVAVAAGRFHSLALTEEGHVYGWGDERVNGHGQNQRMPRRVAALAGEPVKLVYAGVVSSCAVTEKGELYTWGEGNSNSLHLGHGVDEAQPTPKRVEALSGVKVAAAAISGTNTLVAGDDGVVWGFGLRVALGIGAADAPPGDFGEADAFDFGAADAPPGDFGAADAFDFGAADAFNFGAADAPPGDFGAADGPPRDFVVQPTLIPNLRVRTLP